MPICAQCSTDNPDIAKFCLACGAPVTTAEKHEEERKPVTAVFVDLVGSTGRAEGLDPEEVLRLLEPYYHELRVALERHGGTVEKFIGDAVVALFGAPAAHGDDALRAVRASLAVLEAIERLNEEDATRELAVRVGVNTGDAFVALDARWGEGMAWGDMVNTAARIQSAAPPGGVLVGDETYRLTRRWIDYDECAPIEAKGKSEPVLVWRALGVAHGAAPGRPLVGRDAEFEALEALWQQVRSEGRPAFALVVGPPGIGKSRLLEELALRARLDGDRLVGGCLPYGEGMTYWPVLEVIKQGAGILRGDSAAEITAKLGALLEGLPTANQDELRTMAAAVSILLGARATPHGRYSAHELSQAEIHWGLRRLLELFAHDRPLLVVLEDLHWAEPTLLELIRFIVEGAAAPVLVLGSARPGVVAMAADVRLELTPLSPDASEELLQGLLGEAPPELLLRADGNPLFLEELAGAFGSEGAAIPTTLQALIGARLDALTRTVKRVAQHAAVCGTVFWSGAVAVLAESDDVEPSLEELEQRELVHEQEPSTVAGEREWSFKHALIRDVAYGRLSKALRARLHERFARWVAELGAGDSLVEIRAWHLEQACLLSRESPPVDDAVLALTAAAEKAERREGSREADRFYARALDLIDEESDRALELRYRRARLLSTLADHKAATVALSALADETRERDLRRLHASVLVALGSVVSKQGRASEARHRLTVAAEIARQLSDDVLRVQAAFELAHLRGWFEGDLEGAVTESVATADLADRLGDLPLRIEARLRLGTLLFNAGHFAQAERVLREAADLANGLGSVRDAARAVSLLATVIYYRSGVAAAEAEFARSAEWLVRAGDVFSQIQNLCGQAKCALRRRDFELAERYLQDALPLALDAGGWLVVETYRYLVEAVLRQGRVDDALELLALARSALPEEDQYARAAVLIAEGLCAAAVGEEPAVREAFTRSALALEALGLDADAAETRLAYAYALRSLGADGSAEQSAAARRAFARMGAEAFLVEIDADPAGASA
jgi:class 3 adenylate cyclase/tetratricopeptide (TPR) repeat protein